MRRIRLILFAIKIVGVAAAYGVARSHRRAHVAQPPSPLGGNRPAPVAEPPLTPGQNLSVEPPQTESKLELFSRMSLDDLRALWDGRHDSRESPRYFELVRHVLRQRMGIGFIPHHGFAVCPTCHRVDD